MTKRIANRDPSYTLRTQRAKFGNSWQGGTFDELIHGHPAILKGFRTIRDRFFQSDCHISPFDGPKLSEEMFLARCLYVFHTLQFGRDKNKGIEYILEHLSDSVIYGSAVFEATWQNARLVLTPIPQHTITEWVDTPQGAAPRVQQEGNHDTITVPAERIIRVTPIPSVGPQGIGILRPLVFIFEMWKTTLMDIGIRSGNEAGVLIGKQAEGASNEQSATFIESINAASSGDAKYLYMPYGYEVDVLQLPRAESKLPTVEYCDQQIRSIFDDTLTSLVSSDKGSRALGSSISKDSEEEQVRSLESIVARFGFELFSFIAKSIDYEGRIPKLTTRTDKELTDEEYIELISKVSELTGWREEDRNGLRNRLGLKTIEEAGKDVAPVRYMLSRGDSTKEQLNDIIQHQSLIRGRSEDEASFATVIGDLADDLREDLRIALEDGILSATERADLENEYIPLFRAEIQKYMVTRRDKARNWGDRIADASTAGDAQGDADTLRNNMTSAIQRMYDRADVMADASARTMFQRVVGEMESIRSTGGDLTADSRITDKGLSNDGATAGHLAEQAGRLEGAQEAALERGWVLDGAFRVSFEDGNRCDVCTDRDGMFFTHEEMLDAVVGSVVPDNECHGGAQRCRCGLVPRFRRAA